MSLSELFEMQQKLDERIVKEKGLEGHDLLPQKILALQVELGECANEWRGFKYWSKDQSPRTQKWSGIEYKENEFGGVDPVHGTDKYSNPLLEEYIDCLHFLISIGIEISRKCVVTLKDVKEAADYAQAHCLRRDVVEIFSRTFDKVGDMSVFPNKGNYIMTFERFVLLGRELGFTWEQIEEAYKAKNAINHKCQDTGY